MSRRLQVSISDKDAAAIAEAAERERLSQSSWARRVIARELEGAIAQVADEAPPLTAGQAEALAAAGLNRRRAG